MLLVSSLPDRLFHRAMGEHIQQVARSARTIRKHPSKQTSETMARRLLDIIVYAKHCQIGATVSLDDLAETEIGDWTSPTPVRPACGSCRVRTCFRFATSRRNSHCLRLGNNGDI
jgi:hypothetical protein